MTSDGSEDVLHEWDALVKNFNAHKYTVTDCTDKEFVGIKITHDGPTDIDTMTKILQAHTSC